MRERVTTGTQGTSKGRQRLLVSRVKRMHMMVLLCKKPGLSCPKCFLLPHHLSYLQYLPRNNDLMHALSLPKKCTIDFVLEPGTPLKFCRRCYPCQCTTLSTGSR